MTSGLMDPLRHNSWATHELLEFCAGLKREHLDATTEETYGTILATLQHLVDAKLNNGSERAKEQGIPIYADFDWQLGHSKTLPL